MRRLPRVRAQPAVGAAAVDDTRQGQPPRSDRRARRGPAVFGGDGDRQALDAGAAGGRERVRRDV